MKIAVHYIMKSAFTLIELIIVISIIGITSFFSIGGIIRLKDSLSLNAASRQFHAELNLIKQKAISSGTIHELLCKDNYYIIRKQNFSMAYFEEIKRSFLTDNIIFIHPFSFRFAASGFPCPGYFGTAVLKNRFNKTKKIIVSSVGRARIE